METDKIKITDDRLKPYHIVWSKYGFELFETISSKRRDKSTGKLTDDTYEREKNIGMFSSIEAVIKGIIQKKMLKGNKKVVSLVDFYKNYRTLQKELSFLLDLSDETKIALLEKRVKAIEEKLK